MDRIAPGDGEGKFSAGDAAPRRVDLAGTEVLLGDHYLASKINQADRIVVIICDERKASVRAHRYARGLGKDFGTKARLVPERNLARSFESRAAPGEDVQCIVHAAADKERASVRQPRYSPK